MRSIKVILVVAVVLATFGWMNWAKASTVISPESGTSYPYQRWVDEASVPTADVTVRVVDRGCPWSASSSCTYSDEDGSVIYLPPDGIRHRQTLYHELGHLFDYSAMTDTAHAQFLAIRHDPREWRSPPNSPHEQFAEEYSFCAFQARPHRPEAYGYDFWRGIGKHRAACSLIRALAGNQ
jgi:hypothetical protein